MDSETLDRLILAIANQRPIPADLAGWLCNGFRMMRDGRADSLDSALGLEPPPVAQRKAARDDAIRAVAAAMPGNQNRVATALAAGDIPQELRPLLKEAAANFRLPQSPKQFKRILRHENQATQH